MSFDFDLDADVLPDVIESSEDFKSLCWPTMLLCSAGSFFSSSPLSWPLPSAVNNVSPGLKKNELLV
jgi:hypothetical protein